jgi:hypothetical protein
VPFVGADAIEYVSEPLSTSVQDGATDPAVSSAVVRERLAQVGASLTAVIVTPTSAAVLEAFPSLAL